MEVLLKKCFVMLCRIVYSFSQNQIPQDYFQIKQWQIVLVVCLFVCIFDEKSIARSIYIYLHNPLSWLTQLFKKRKQKIEPD